MQKNNSNYIKKIRLELRHNHILKLLQMFFIYTSLRFGAYRTKITRKPLIKRLGRHMTHCKKHTLFSNPLIVGHEQDRSGNFSTSLAKLGLFLPQIGAC